MRTLIQSRIRRSHQPDFRSLFSIYDVQTRNEYDHNAPWLLTKTKGSILRIRFSLPKHTQNIPLGSDSLNFDIYQVQITKTFNVNQVSYCLMRPLYDRNSPRMEY